MEYSIKEIAGIIGADAQNYMTLLSVYCLPTAAVFHSPSKVYSLPSRQRPTTDIIIYKDYINYVYATS